MPRNIFADPMGGLRDGYEAAESITQDIRRKYAGARAAPRIAAGDYGGAAEDFAAMGMVDETNQLRGQQERADALGAAQEARMGEQEMAQAKERADLLMKVAGALKAVPAGGRKAALSQVYPIFQSAGIDTGIFDGLAEEQLTDQSLDLFTGEIQQQTVKLFNTANGVVAVDEAAAARGDPNAARLVYEDPLAGEYRRAQIDATRARAGASSASAEAARARAAKTRTGGGGGLSQIKTEDLIKAVRGY